MTMHRRCQVFRGESNDSSELLFSVKKSKLLQSGVMRLDVFLANNKKESECDFRVNVVSGKRTCHVYAGESPTIVASVCAVLRLLHTNLIVSTPLHKCFLTTIIFKILN